MRFLLILSLSLLTSYHGFSQFNKLGEQGNKKGEMYFYWGWNWGWYSPSEIHFQGVDYDFTLSKVKAKDRQSKFDFDTYFNPARVTIPQFNFRLGYFIKDNWDISFGTDHMKYVVIQDQLVKISGEIEEHSDYSGSYDNDDIFLDEDFLKFEHTDGLNYINTELRHSNQILSKKDLSVNLMEGFGAGILLPRTNTTLLGKERYDEFHLSGYGFSAVAGINAIFFQRIFIQSEFKAGFINLPNIRSTKSKLDKASQNFFFSQLNVVFGVRMFSGKRAEVKNYN